MFHKKQTSGTWVGLCCQTEGSPYVRLSGRLVSLPRVKAMKVLSQMVEPSLFVMPSITCSSALFSPILCHRLYLCSAVTGCIMAKLYNDCSEL